MTILQLLAHIVGLLGTACIVFSFHQTTSGRWDSQGNTFAWVNLTGAVLLLLSLLVHFNFGSFVIELFWITISLRSIYRNAVKYS